MPIDVQVLEHEQVLQVTFVEPWQRRDMNTLIQQEQHHRDTFQRSHPDQKVHLIVDFSATIHPPQGYLQARHSASLSHPTSGLTVIVGANPLLQQITAAGFAVSGYTCFAFVDTRDEALALVREELSKRKEAV